MGNQNGCEKTIEVGEGLSAAGKAPGTHLLNMTQQGPPDMSGGARLSLKDTYAMQGNEPQGRRAKVTMKAEGSDRVVGGFPLAVRPPVGAYLLAVCPPAAEPIATPLFETSCRNRGYLYQRPASTSKSTISTSQY